MPDENGREFKEQMARTIVDKVVDDLHADGLDGCFGGCASMILLLVLPIAGVIYLAV